MMAWIRDLVRAGGNLLGPRVRRFSLTNRRAYLEMRTLPVEMWEAYANEVERHLVGQAGVRRVTMNPWLGRVVVEPADEETVHELADELDELDRRLGVQHLAFSDTAPEHPGDLEPLLRLALEIGGDAAGFWLAVAGRFLNVRVLSFQIDLLAMGALLEGVPRLHGYVDRAVGSQAADLVLTIANAIGQGLVQTPVGPFVDATRRGFELTEALARRRLWTERERSLADHLARPAAVADVPARPAAIASGEIEAYAEKAVFGSLGAFGVGAVTTGDLSRATAGLFGGLPKPAVLGREGFVGQLHRALAARGVLVLDRAALSLLDRLDTLVVDATVAAPGDPRFEALVQAARRQLAHVDVLSDPHPDRVVSRVRELQADGRVVGFVSDRPTPGLAVADLGIGLLRPSVPVPWGADAFCNGGLEDVRYLVEACPAAREASAQAVVIAEAGAGLALLLSVGGLRRTTPGQVMGTVHAAALVSMLNGARLALAHDAKPLRVPAQPPPWHALETRFVLARLETSPEGLTERQVEDRRHHHRRRPSRLVRMAEAIVDQLDNPLTPILAVSAGLSAAVGSVVDAAMVASVGAVNAFVGASQQLRTDDAIVDLERREHPLAHVLRDGTLVTCELEALVPGDVLVLGAGDVVPADARILESAGLEVDESSLTGESLPVVKDARPVQAVDVAERTCMLYAGTSIAAGSTRAVVVAVGDEVEALRNEDDVSSGPPATGVELRLRSLLGLANPVAIGGGLAVVASGLLRGQRLTDVLGSAVGATVAAVPEGLPIVGTLAQLAASQRLAQRGALVRNSRAVEALGRVDTICVDKTGTLTEGHIDVHSLTDGLPGGGEVSVELAREILACALRATPERVGGGKLPHPTDRGLERGAARGEVQRSESCPAWSARAEIPFEPGRGYHAILGETQEGQCWLAVKGAPEVVLPRCVEWHRRDGTVPLDDVSRQTLGHEVLQFARRGLRVLAIADRAHASLPLDDTSVAGLRFRGFALLSDPVRPTAAEATAELRRAGVRLIMMTGDHPSTAERIAADLNLLGANGVLTGSQLDRMGEDELDARLPGITVLARVTPAHKVRIVRALQRLGGVVAMTGDGANDAPAIRLAHVGVALGTRATSAARDAADVVITDDRIETLVDAVLEGRATWAAVRDAVSVLLGGNLGEIGFVVGTSLLTGSSALGARQLLLVNLLTDALPAAALAVRPPPAYTAEQLLREGPEVSLGASLEREILARGLTTFGSAFGAWAFARLTGTAARASTVGLATVIGTQLGQTLIAGSQDPFVRAVALGSTAAGAAVIQTPLLSQLFGCRPLGPVAWATVLGASAAGTAGAILLPRVLPDFEQRIGRLVERPADSTPPAADASPLPEGASAAG